MRIAVVGIGSMGAALGHALSAAGHEVVHLVRPGSSSKKPQAIRFRAWLPSGRTAPEYRPKYLETRPDFDPDCILAPVKSYQVIEVAEQLARWETTAPVVVMSNLWDEFDGLEAVLKGRYLFGFAHFGGALAGDEWFGRYTKRVSLGEPGVTSSKRLAAAAKLFRSAGFEPRLLSDMKAWLLTHFAFNCGLISGALGAKGLDRLGRNPRRIGSAIEGMKEAFDVVTARGVDPFGFPEETFLARIPKPLAVAAVLLFSVTPTFRNAVKYPHADGRELKSYWFSVVGSARRVGVPTPTLDSMKDAVETTSDDLFRKG